VVLATAAVFGIVFGIVRGNAAGWGSPEVLIPLIGGSALLAGFLLWERRTPTPLLPLRLFRDRSFAVANLVATVFSFGAFGSVFLLVQFLQVAQGHSPLTAGLMTMPWTLAPMVIAPLAGAIAPRVGTRLLIVTGLALLAAGLYWIGGTLSTAVAYTTQLPGYILAGVGMGLVFAPISTAVLANTAPADQAKATGTNSALREIGVALGIAVLAAIFTANGGLLEPAGYAASAQPAVLVGASALALAAVLALLLPAGRAVRSAVPQSPADAVVAAAPQAVGAGAAA
jgi:MFS family permease